MAMVWVETCSNMDEEERVMVEGGSCSNMDL